MRYAIPASTGLVICFSVFLLVGCDEPSSPELSQMQASKDRLEADVRFLSDDLLEGREAGTRGYDLAAHYVAEQFRAIGLEPAGNDGTYYQAVPMLQFGPGATSTLRIGEVELVAREDYLVPPSSRGETIDISAPLVFGGMCFESEREGRDDFAGLDLEGRIAACFMGAPKYLNSEERAHYQSAKVEGLSARGAIGAIGIYTQTNEQVFPFEQFERLITPSFSRMTWISDTGAPFSRAPNLQALAVLSLAGAEKVFASSGKSWDELLAAAESDAGEVQGFELDVEASLHAESWHRRLASDNVVALLPGSDPVLRGEYVILTAHLDHVGIKPTPEDDDDEIYNGAMDNASGVSSLLEVARLLRASPPKRSVIFIALTAEEKGLTGSDYFARNPTVPSKSIVAAVNLDMPIVTYDFADLVAFGAERSTLYEPVRKRADAHGLTLTPDPNPDEGMFTRTDVYSFVKQGVPAVYLDLGFAHGGEQAQAEFRENHYHQPSDEVEYVNFDALRRFAEVNADIVRDIANMSERPVWDTEDFFGSTFGGPMASD